MWIDQSRKVSNGRPCDHRNAPWGKGASACPCTPQWPTPDPTDKLISSRRVMPWDDSDARQSTKRNDLYPPHQRPRHRPTTTDCNLRILFQVYFLLHLFLVHLHFSCLFLWARIYAPTLTCKLQWFEIRAIVRLSSQIKEVYSWKVCTAEYTQKKEKEKEKV